MKPGLTRAQWRLLRELYAMAPHPAMRTALTHVWASTLQVLERRGLIVTWDADWPDACYARLIVLSRRGAGAVEAYFPEDRARVWNLLSFLPHAEASS